MLSKNTADELKLDEDQMSNIEFDDENCIHLIAEELSEVLEDFDFHVDLVEHAKRMFIMVEPDMEEVTALNR